MSGDDFDLETLRVALSPPPSDPPPSSISALRHAVERQFAPRRRAPWWKARITVVTVVGATIFSGSASAYAISGAVLPEPLREALHAAGLPVDSVDLARVKSAESQLESALEHQNADEVYSDAQLLQKRASQLRGSDESEVGTGVQKLLSKADHFESEHGEISPLVENSGEGGDDSSTGQTAGNKDGSPPESGDGGSRSGGDAEPGSTPTTTAGARDGDGGSGSNVVGEVSGSTSEGGASSPNTTTTAPSGTSSSVDGDGASGGSTGDGGSATPTTSTTTVSNQEGSGSGS